MTKLLVLGLLDGGPMSGYDLQPVSYTHLTLSQSPVYGGM